jgi:hypothetical protein
MSSSLPPLVGSLFTLAFAIAAIVVMSIMIEHNSSKQLQELRSATLQLNHEIDNVEGNIPATLNRASSIATQNANFHSCIDTGNARCSNLTISFLEKQSNITIYDVNYINNTYQGVKVLCDVRNLYLQTLISMIPGNVNPPQLIQNGTVNVTLASEYTFLSTYQLYKLTLPFTIYYVILPPWTLSILSPISSPLLTYTQFVPPLSSCVSGVSLGGIRPLFGVQSNRFSQGSVFGSCEIFCNGDLNFYSGNVTLNNGVFSLNQKLNIIN